MKFSIFTGEKNLYIAWASFHNEKTLQSIVSGLYVVK